MTAVIVKDGALAGRRFELGDADLVVGREGADITLDDSQLSRRHARLALREGAVEVEDLGSTNGTYVNGARIEAPTRLSPGDTVRIGTTTLQLEGAGSSATVASPVPAPPAAAPAAPAPAPPAPAAPAVAAASASPLEPFGTYLAPASRHRGGGIQSRQLGPMLLTYAAVLATAIAMAIYFGFN
jgi:predicted component of type VI protein secretion system